MHRKSLLIISTVHTNCHSKHEPRSRTSYRRQVVLQWPQRPQGDSTAKPGTLLLNFVWKSDIEEVHGNLSNSWYDRCFNHQRHEWNIWHGRIMILNRMYLQPIFCQRPNSNVNYDNVWNYQLKWYLRVFHLGQLVYYNDASYGDCFDIWLPVALMVECNAWLFTEWICALVSRFWFQYCSTFPNKPECLGE